MEHSYDKEHTYDIQAMNIEKAGYVSSDLKKFLINEGIDKKLLRRIIVAVYEAEINVVIHSYGGTCRVQYQENKKIKIQFKDTGPGIENIDQAMEAGFSTASRMAREHGFGAGMGLANIKEAADQFAISSTPAGTILEIDFFL